MVSLNQSSICMIAYHQTPNDANDAAATNAGKDLKRAKRDHVAFK
jgi:hypothetical protein